MMNNPLEKPIPETKREKLESFARDFIYGVEADFWPSNITVMYTIGSDYKETFNNMPQSLGKLLDKWEGNIPNIEDFVTYGYFRRVDKKYVPTQKTIDLLQKPAEAPKIFISYKRSESSTLALLIEARLRIADSTMRPFIDKNIPTQTRWDNFIKQQVEQCEVMICLLGLKTLESKFVRDEILEAMKLKKKFISVLHQGFYFPEDQGDLDDTIWGIMQELDDWQAVPVEQPPSAEKYETAINRILVDMGYSTY